MHWRVSYRVLALELAAHVVILLCLSMYFDRAPVLSTLFIFVVLHSIFISINQHKKNIGVVCRLTFNADEEGYWSFLRDDEMQLIRVSNVSLLWYTAVCMLIEIRPDAQPNKSWRQWIYSAELTREDYSSILRNLR